MATAGVETYSFEVMAPTTPGGSRAIGDLNKVVAGLTAFVIDFDGPATAYIGTDPLTAYVTLCSHGVKAEGEQPLTFGQQEAIELYAEQLRLMIAENNGKHLAWRLRPRIEYKGDPAACCTYCVRSRLAFI